jgi:hypothetical protein
VAPEPDSGRLHELQVRLAAQKVLSKHLYCPDPDTPPETFWDGMGIDLSTATVIDVELADCRIGRARFAGTVFEGDTRFSAAAFTDITEFAGASFKGRAEFKGAEFASVTLFDNVTFTGRVLFDTKPIDNVRLTGARVTDHREKHGLPNDWRIVPNKRDQYGVIEHAQGHKHP